MIDLEAIRARNRERETNGMFLGNDDLTVDEYSQSVLDDLDALLAEVERLRSGHVVMGCLCGHGPENHVVTRSCRKCPDRTAVIFDGARWAAKENHEHGAALQIRMLNEEIDRLRRKYEPEFVAEYLIEPGPI